MYATLFQLMGMMFLLMMIGAFLKKKGIITDAGKKSITDLIIYAVLPGNILKAFCTDSGEGVFVKCSILLVVAILVQVLALMISKFAYTKMKSNEIPVYQYGTVCSNSGFIGNPLAEGFFGTLGLVYASVFLIPQRVIMWTAGVSYFEKSKDKKSAYKKILTHPCMLATYIGFIIMFGKITLPVVLMKTITSLSNCCTALTMLYMGFILADVHIKELFGLKQFYYCFIRLVGMPLIIYAGCKVCQIDPLITGVSVLLTGMPAGSTTALLASKYGADEKVATKCVVLSTVFSIITIPIWGTILLSGVEGIF